MCESALNVVIEFEEELACENPKCPQKPRRWWFRILSFKIATMLIAANSPSLREYLQADRSVETHRPWAPGPVKSRRRETNVSPSPAKSAQPTSRKPASHDALERQDQLRRDLVKLIDDVSPYVSPVLRMELRQLEWMHGNRRLLHNLDSQITMLVTKEKLPAEFSRRLKCLKERQHFPKNEED